MPLLIDHMGRPDLRRGEDDPNLLATRRLVEEQGAWVLLTLAGLISLGGPPWEDVVPIARTLIALAPDRCLWGSDWPHLGNAGAAPADAALVGLLARFAPDAEQRHSILVTNPTRLFGPAR